MSKFDDFLARKLQDPQIKEAYEDSRERHEIVQTLIAERKARGLSQTEVAERMGVKQPTVSGIETDESDPRLSTLQRYARAIGVNLCSALGAFAQTRQSEAVRMQPVFLAKPYGNFDNVWASTTYSTRTDFAKAG